MEFYPPAAEIEIGCPLEQVWGTLLDGRTYPNWNQFILNIDGELRTLNTPIKMEVKLGQHTVRPTMMSVRIEDPVKSHNQTAIWVHRYYGVLPRLSLLCSERHHELQSLRSGEATLYKTHEIFWGVLKHFTPFRHIDAGFKQQASDLKAYCERQA